MSSIGAPGGRDGFRARSTASDSARCSRPGGVTLPSTTVIRSGSGMLGFVNYTKSVDFVC